MLENNEPTPEKPEQQTPAGNSAGSQPRGSGGANDDFIAQLKQGLKKTRLPADLREEILASFPPPEECERLYRQLRDEGGLSSEEFLGSLGLNTEPDL